MKIISAADKPKILNRFTSIDTLYEIVQNSKLKLSNPKFWEDKNDVEYIEAYKKKKLLKQVLALCFTDESETIYHWKAFSETINSCCIEFNAEKLLQLIDGKKGFRFGKVKYLKISELKKELVNIDDIPFCKRYPYRNECEYRIIFDSTYPISTKNINIDLSLINDVTINQKININIYKNIKTELETKYNINVIRSTVIKNTRWIKHIEGMKII